MRKGYPSIVRVLVALAMVASLVGIAVAPVGAQVSAVTVEASPATAADGATYTIDFTTAQNTTAGQALTVTFPSEVTLPSGISKSYIALQPGLTAGFVDFSGDNDPDPVVSGQDVIITIPAGDQLNAGACQLTISQGAGITNPKIAKTRASKGYEVKVKTTNEASATGYLGIIPSYKLNVTHGVRFGSVTVTGKGWAASSSVAIGNALDGSGSSDADGTFSVTAAPVDDGVVTVEDGAGQTESDGKWDYAVTLRNFDLDPRIELNPTSGRVDAKVTVKGYDFTSTANLQQITVGGVVVWNTATALETKDAWRTLDDFNVDIYIPLTIGSGSKEVKATDSAGDDAKATFSVAKPTLTLNPTGGSVGDTLTVVGTNFGSTVGGTAGDKVDFAPNGVALYTKTGLETDASGSFTTSFEVPQDAKSGYNKVKASIGGTTASADYLVAGRALSLLPDHGPMGIEITLSGKDMSPKKEVPTGNVLIEDVRFDEFDENIEIDSLGNIPPTSMVVPMGLGVGPNKVTATDDQGVTAEGSYEVEQPNMLITPERGYMGDTLTVNGSGWIPGGDELVTLKFNTKTMLTIEPDANGNFNARFDVPLSAGDSNEVRAFDGYGNTAPTRIYYLDDPELDIDPQSGPIGTEVVIKGVGFQPQFPVEELKVGGATVLPLGGLLTDTQGAFETTAKIPGLSDGSHTVNVKVKNDEPTTFFTVTKGEDTSADALASIIDKVVIVWGYVDGEWLFFDPSDPASDLTKFTVGMGFWIKVSEDCTLIYGGNSYELKEGWTNIGWLGK